MARERNPSTVSAPTQPSVPPSSTASGATMNCPSEPPEFTMPLASPRFSGGRARATEDISTPSPAMPLPPAEMMPMKRISIQVVLAYGVSTVPSMTNTPPMATIRPVPYLSAKAPATGCVIPHMSCAHAKARLIEAIPKPVAELIGPMNSATDWRTPKISANTSPAAAMIPSWRRVIARELQQGRRRLSSSCRLPVLYDHHHIPVCSGSKQRITRFEVRVEAAVRQTRFFHDIGDADAVFANGARGGAGCVSHMRIIIFLTTCPVKWRLYGRDRRRRWDGS